MDEDVGVSQDDVLCLSILCAALLVSGHYRKGEMIDLVPDAVDLYHELLRTAVEAGLEEETEE